MKRILSMVLAGVMAISVMPVTAFAKNNVTATAKIVSMLEVTKAEVEANHNIINEVLGDMPELQIKVQDVSYKHTGTGVAPEEVDVTVSLDNAKFLEDQDLESLVSVRDDDNTWVIEDGESKKERLAVSVDERDADEDTVTFTFNGNFEKDDIIVIDLYSVMDKTSEGRTATVSVESEMVSVDDLTYVSVMSKGLKATVKKLETVAVEEVAEISSKGLKIEAAVGNLPSELTLKLSKGFEFLNSCDGLKGDGYSITKKNDTELTVAVEEGRSEINIKGVDGINNGQGILIEATTAKVGDIATIKVSAKNYDSTSIEVMEVVEYTVEMTVDEDEDLPVIYSGVGVDNYGLTDDSDHLSLEITVEESFPGAWNMKKAFYFKLPEGVYVAEENSDGVNGVDVTEVEGLYLNGKEASADEVEGKFLKAYQDGDYVEFEFKRRTFDDVNTTTQSDPAKLTFTLTLVADPTFEGEVDLTLTGDDIDEQTVTIAEFVKPYEVKAERNDLKIDYRYTKVPTAITVTEPEAGLWEEKEAVFALNIEKGNVIQFEKDATFTVNEDSEMKLNCSTNKNNGTLAFQVKEASDDEAAVVTISDMELYMSRDIPAGFYDLLLTTSMEQGSDMDVSFSGKGSGDGYLDTVLFGGVEKDDYTVGDVSDYENVVKEGFINIITGGRDEDGFTTKVVVPIGADYILSGENKIALDVPAYINDAGYTMLPVRAVANALGIDKNAVLWDQPTRTVTIMYGQRIITMTYGQKVIYVNGSALPASSAVEIKDDRTFLPMRDLATALGVLDIEWDAVNRTATLNGNQ
ncbi:copper amine oxidase N-terminal domain-containing protein [Anaerotignum sp.]